MKHLIKPLLKAAVIMLFTALFVWAAPYYIDFMAEADLLSWAGMEVEEDNQALIKVFLTMVAGMILFYWPIATVFRDEDRLIPVILIYLMSVFVVSVSAESGTSSFSQSILWELSIFGNIILATWLLTKHYYINQDKPLD